MFTLPGTLSPELHQYLAGTSHVMCGTNQLPERSFEVLRQVQPVPTILPEALQEFRQVARDMPLLTSRVMLDVFRGLSLAPSSVCLFA